MEKSIKICCFNIFAFTLIIFSFCIVKAEYLPYIDPGRYINMSENTVPLTLKLPNGKETSEKIIYHNNRICVPLISIVEKMGGSLKKINNETFNITYNNKNSFIPIKPTASNRCIMVYKDGTAYISLYYLLENFDLTPVFDIENNKIKIYNRTTDMEEYALKSNPSGKSAYIRFEDIMADGLDVNPDYSTESLEKLLYIANYMYKRGEEYYIAWIPLYSSPKTNCVNNISENNNLYNACFVYTLDYMIEHGGHIGLHGFTHQYNNDKSADGYEWGKNTPYNYIKQQERMIYAKTIAARMGYNIKFFEFPHYAATKEQFKMAEYYFDTIYQSYPSERLKNNITYTTASGKKVYYIPTPADYVHNDGDKEGTIERLKNCIKNNYEVSLFYHPKLDTIFSDGLTVITDEEKMQKSWFLSNSSVLRNIVTYIQDNGYKFTSLKK